MVKHGCGHSGHGNVKLNGRMNKQNELIFFHTGANSEKFKVISMILG